MPSSRHCHANPWIAAGTAATIGRRTTWVARTGDRPLRCSEWLAAYLLGTNSFAAVGAQLSHCRVVAHQARPVDAYQAFIDKIRARYGPRTYILVSATYMYNTTALADLTQQIVRERNTAGDDRVRYWCFDGLDYLGSTPRGETNTCSTPTATADQRLSPDRPSRHPPTPTVRRHPQRIPPRCLTCTDDISASARSV